MRMYVCVKLGARRRSFCGLQLGAGSESAVSLTASSSSPRSSVAANARTEQILRVLATFEQPSKNAAHDTATGRAFQFLDDDIGDGPAKPFVLARPSARC